MAYPVRALVRPAVLEGQANGRLPTRILDTTPGQAGGLAVQLVSPAARAWRALSAAAADAGHVLKLSGAGCGYRSYEVQERIFRERYTTTYLPDRPYKTWNGVRWYQRWGTAVAAIPGTSNHGWGLAVDVGEERDSDADTESLDSGTLGWLLANEERFGWSHELQSEPWHLRYFTGDAIPQAVVDHERQPSEEDDMTEDQARTLDLVSHAVNNLLDVATRLDLWRFAEEQKGDDFDEQAVIATLVPVLSNAATIAKLSDADVERIAKASADEQARRLGG